MSAVAQEGLQVQTLFCRAPILLLGGASFAAVVDSWPLGVVLAESSGWLFAHGMKGASFSQWGYMVATFQQLGTPPAEVFGGLPLWPAKRPSFRRKPWLPRVASCLGASGFICLDGLLARAPAERLTAQAAPERA